MTGNRVLLTLVALTVLMQSVVLYNQYRRSSKTQNAATRPSVTEAPQGVVIDLAGLPTKGGKNAKVVLVEFSDYECPFCRRHANGVGKQLETSFIDNEEIRHVFANNPLPIHPDAKFLATAAICAGQQNHYWEMHDSLFSETPMTKDQIVMTAEKLNLDSVRFMTCLDYSPEPDSIINRDLQSAKSLGLNVTPAFVLGRVDSKGHFRGDRIISGAQPFAIFDKEIKAALSSN